MNNWKRNLISLLAISSMLLLAGCSNATSGTPTESGQKDSQKVEQSIDAKTEYEKYQDDFVAPTNYAATVVVTINPEVRLYLDKNNEILAVEYLNQDAMEAYNELELVGESYEVVVEQMVQAAIDQDFLKEGREVTVTVEKIESPTISVQDIQVMNEKLEASVNKVIATNEITATVNVVVDEAANNEAVSNAETETATTEKAETSNICTKCNGTGNSCQECGGTAIVNCKRCVNGVESCGTCHGTAVINCHGCHGNGINDHNESCNYCGGSGRISCDACNGQGTFLCSWCKGELRHICPECWGEGVCDACGGTGRL